jgi:hypothetical protein
MDRAVTVHDDVAGVRDSRVAKMSCFACPHTCEVTVDISVQFIVTWGFED